MNELQTIRNIAVMIACLGNGHEYGNSDGNRLGIDIIKIIDRMAAEPSEDAREFATTYIRKNSYYTSEYSYQVLKDEDGDELAEAIIDRDERIIRECADKAEAWYRSGQMIPAKKETYDIKQLRAAIMGGKHE